MRGQRFGPYEILEPLGKGGMGEVYRAEDTTLQRQVAIKVLPEDMAEDPERHGRLKREARSLAALKHVNVATVHGFEEHDGTSFIVMELVEGQTLAERLEEGALPVEESFEIATQIARGLEAAHERGIVHRDLKPQNVMIEASGQVKLLDFGIAKQLRQSSSPTEELRTATVAPTETGTVLGSPPYMSPEQIRGERVDARTDIWALGCLLYEMLTGRRAFAAETASDTLADILRREPDWSRLPGTTPPSVQRLLRRMLRKDPDRRVRDVGDVRVDLEDTLAERQRPAEGQDVPAPGTASSRRWLLPAAVIMLAVIVAAALLIAWPWGAESDPATPVDRSVAVLPFETIGEETSRSFADGIHGDMLTRLANVSDLRVTSRTSVMQFRDARRPLPEIARALGVNWILRGEVQEAGGRIQLNVRLVEAPEDRQVWAKTYRRALTAENLFEIQGELTREIAEQLQARLSDQEAEDIARAHTADLEAYRLYIRGREALDQRTERHLRQAVEYFQRALADDPGYALAQSGLADGLSLLDWYRYGRPEDAPTPEQAAQRALELGPQLAEPHVSLGIVHSLHKDAPAARREFVTAIERRPSYSEAHIWLAWLYIVTGQPDAALEAAEGALELDPLSPVTRVFGGEAYLVNEQPEQALAHFRRARQLQPGYGLAHFMEGLAFYHLGQYGQAEAALREAMSRVPPRGSPTHAEIRAALAVVATVTGRTEDSREILSRIDPDTAPFSAGLLHAALGELDTAFEMFGRVREWESFAPDQLRYMYPEVLGPLRGDGRYVDLLEEIDRSWNLDGARVEGGE